MTAEFQLDETVVDRIAALPAVREAAQAAAGLIALWPLTDAMQMDNDAKYAENLQVRITRTMAAMMTGEDVTVPDAEYVYEGADWIPGRPQTIVDALLAANDAYDLMADYSETGDVTLVRTPPPHWAMPARPTTPTCVPYWRPWRRRSRRRPPTRGTCRRAATRMRSRAGSRS